MTEQLYAQELQRESNIDKIKKAVIKVSKQRKVECSDELNFDEVSYLDIENDDG